MSKDPHKDKIYVSIYNDHEEVKQGLKIPEEIIIYDTTLRDGEQTPGVSFSLEQKVEIAKLLDEIGIHQIEAGFPVVSKEEERAVKAVANEGLNAEILALTRLKRCEIDLAIDCGVDMVLLFIAASELHRKYKLKCSFEELEARITEIVDYSKSHGLKTSFSIEDSTRSNWDIIERFFSAAIESGADRIGITDTVGCIHPEALTYLVKEVSKISPVPISIHLHNDFGLALANAIAGVQAGAQAVSTTTNGIGERAGNVPLVEFVIAMKVLYGYDCRFKTERFQELCELVSKHSGISVPCNQPLVGQNIFSHESGIHVAAVLNNPATYECIPPELVGNQRRIIMGKHSGTRMIEAKLSEQGISASKMDLENILEKVKNRGEMNGSVDNNEFWDIVNSVMKR
jgi:isopropylmalate/homocitrate/citramalate synthase